MLNAKHKSLAIAHSNCLEKAEKLRDLILNENQFEDVMIYEIGAIMGTYASSGGLLVSVL